MMNNSTLAITITMPMTHLSTMLSKQMMDWCLWLSIPTKNWRSSTILHIQVISTIQIHKRTIRPTPTLLQIQLQSITIITTTYPRRTWLRPRRLKWSSRSRTSRPQARCATPRSATSRWSANPATPPPSTSKTRSSARSSCPRPETRRGSWSSLTCRPRSSRCTVSSPACSWTARPRTWTNYASSTCTTTSTTSTPT